MTDTISATLHEVGVNMGDHAETLRFVMPAAELDHEQDVAAAIPEPF